MPQPSAENYKDLNIYVRTDRYGIPTKHLRNVSQSQVHIRRIVYATGSFSKDDRSQVMGNFEDLPPYFLIDLDTSLYSSSFGKTYKLVSYGYTVYIWLYIVYIQSTVFIINMYSSTSYSNCHN